MKLQGIPKIDPLTDVEGRKAMIQQASNIYLCFKIGKFPYSMRLTEDQATEFLTDWAVDFNWEFGDIERAELIIESASQ